MGGREVGREGGREGWRMLCSGLTSVGRWEFLASSSFSPVPSSWKGNHRRAGEAAASTRAAAAAAASGRGAVPPAPPASPGLRLTRAWKRSRSPRPPPAPRPAPAQAAAARIAARGGSQCAGAAARCLARPRGPCGSAGLREARGRVGVARERRAWELGAGWAGSELEKPPAPCGRWGEGMVVEGAGAVSMTTALPCGRGPGAELRGGWRTGTETQCERDPGGEKELGLNSRNKA